MQTARLESTSAAVPAARLVIQNRCGVGSVLMGSSIAAVR
jgi:hypothetical protein